MSEQHRTWPRAASSRHTVSTQARDGMDALQTHLVQLVHFFEPCGLGAIPGSPAHDGVRGRRGAGPDQVIIVIAARVCRAAGLELGDGAEPGAGCIADGYGLGKVLVFFAFRGHPSPHRAAIVIRIARMLPPAVLRLAGIRRLGVGAAPHLAAGSIEAHSQHASARWDGCVANAPRAARPLL